MLSNEENLELISLAQQGDEDAKAKLITENMEMTEETHIDVVAVVEGNEAGKKD